MSANLQVEPDAMNALGVASISPREAHAGQKGRWDILYTVGSRGIREGGGLRVFGPRYGYDRWTLGKVLAFCSDNRVHLEVRTENTDPPSYHYCHQAAATITVYGRDLEPGQTIRVTIGAVGGYVSGRRVQAVAQTHVGPTRFNVLVDCMGNGQFSRESHRAGAYQPCEGELDIRMLPAAPARIALTVRPPARPGAQLIAIASVRDRFRNAHRSDAFELRLFTEHGELQPPQAVTKPADADSVRFALPCPPGGVTYLAASDWRRGVYGLSNPIAPDFFGDGVQAYFGDMHVMTGSSGIPSMLGTTDSALCYARDMSALDFTAVTNSFKQATIAGDFEAFAAHHRDHEFVTLPALEVGFRTGHKNVFFADGATPQINPKSVQTLWESLAGRDCIMIGHHPNTHAETDPDEWGVHDLGTINPRFERHMEICQSRGSFEHDEVGGEVQFGGHGSSVRDALALGHRLGFVGGTDSHRGQPGLAASNLSGLDAAAHITGAITAVLAPELTREAIWKALLARRCYATTCVRILLDYRVNGHAMGSDIMLSGPSRAAWSTRRVALRVAGTAMLDRAVVVRNGREVATLPLNGMVAEIDWTDGQSLDDVIESRIRGVYYYVKVYQRDGNIAWASPIWLTTES